MDALDAIERRIEQLNRIVGTVEEPVATVGSAATSTSTSATAAAASGAGAAAENLTDALLSANTLIASSLAGREKISAVVKRSAELEHMLDPDYLDEQQAVKAKEVYVNTVAPDLAATFEKLEQIKKLEPALGAEHFRSMPDVTEQLQTMSETSAELTQRNDLLEESLTLAMQRYDEVQSGINRSLQDLNERIDQLEEKLRAKRTKQRDAREADAAEEVEKRAKEAEEAAKEAAKE